MLPALFIACSFLGPAPSVTGDDDDGGSSEDCVVLLDSVDPADSQTQVSHYTAVTASFSGVDDSATLTLASDDGPVAGDLVESVGPYALTLQPDGPLQWTETYTASATWCDGQAHASWSFQTQASETGTAASLEGHTWWLDLQGGRWTQPDALGEVLAAYIDGAVLLQVISDDGDALTMRVASERHGGQDPCQPSSDVVANYLWPPWFSIELVGLRVATDADDLFDDSFVIHDVSLVGGISSDGTVVTDGMLTGTLDLRTMTFLGETDPIESCALVEGFGISCEACSDGPSLCLGVEIRDLLLPAIDVDLEATDGDCDGD